MFQVCVFSFLSFFFHSFFPFFFQLVFPYSYLSTCSIHYLPFIHQLFFSSNPDRKQIDEAGFYFDHDRSLHFSFFLPHLPSSFPLLVVFDYASAPTLPCGHKKHGHTPLGVPDNERSLSSPCVTRLGSYSFSFSSHSLFLF